MDKTKISGKLNELRERIALNAARLVALRAQHRDVTDDLNAIRSNSGDPALPHLATAAARKPIPKPAQKPVDLVSAAEYLARKDTSAKMLNSQFNQLEHSDRNAFMRDGGKLIADPRPIKR